MGQCCSKQKRNHYTRLSHGLSANSRSRNNSNASTSRSSASKQFIAESANEQPGPSNRHDEDKFVAVNPPSTPQQKAVKQASKDHSVGDKQNIDMREASVSGSSIVGVQGNVHQGDVHHHLHGDSHHGDNFSLPHSNITGNIGPHGTINIENYYNNAQRTPPSTQGTEDICDDKKAPSEADKVAAIKKHQEEHIKGLPESVALYDKKTKQHQLPDVHPAMHAYDAYEGEQPVKKDKFIPSTMKQDFDTPLHKQPVSFDTILNISSHKKFITLVGPPGSGKTTLSKQLAKRQENHHVSSSIHEPKSVMFLLRFMDLNYEQHLTCKQLFVDFLCPGFDDKTGESAFQWMIANQDKCVFVLDGYDQAIWSLENMKSLNVSYDTPLPIDQLIANLCCKKFFKESLLLFTSRPHKILKIPPDLRPDVTVYVDDLSTEDMEKLFRALAGDKADELWEMVSNKTPQLLGLCHNPLLLQFIIFAISHGDINKVKTVTEVFKAVLEQLRYSDHARNRDIAKLWEPIGKMAYEGMLEETVVFNTEHLGCLKAADVQDIIIVFARKFGFPSQRLFDGDQLFYFSHQTLQEMFAAKYMCESMSHEEFNIIILEVAEGGYWLMVRRFLCGLLLGDKTGMQATSCKTADQLSTIRQAFREKLIEYMKTDVRKYELIDLLTDLQECSDDEKDFLVSHLPVKFHFSFTPISSSAAHALAEILPRLNRTVEWLYLDACYLNSDTLRVICGGISKMKHGMEELNLTGNMFGNSGVEIISASGCLTEVKKLELEECRISDDGKQILYRELERLGLPRSTVDFDDSDYKDSDEENEFSDSDEDYFDEIFDES